MNPIDCMPVLIKCGDIIFEYLKKHLTDEQISDFLRYLNRPGETYGEAFRYITQNHCQSETIFEAIVSLERIRNMCDAAENPSQKPISADGAFHVALSTLRAGLLVGKIAYDEQRKVEYPITQHGMKFALSVGKHDDRFTKYLESKLQEFLKWHGRIPQNKEIRAMIEGDIGNSFVHSVSDDGSVEWGFNYDVNVTGWKAIEKRCTKIRKKIKKDLIKKST